MDDRSFDSLVKSLAAGRNRRSVLKGLLGLGGATVIGTVASSGASAARRPTPTPKPVTCPGSQIWNGSACVCSSGTQCGAACCPPDVPCCDGACCFGICYGEELCCPGDQIVCNGVCLPFGVECTDDSCCGEGGICDQGVCITCRGDGSGCNANQDCCSGICQAGVCWATVGGTCPAGASYCAGQNAVFCNGTNTCYCAQLSDGTSVCMDGPTCAATCDDCPEGSFCDGPTNCCDSGSVTCIVPCPPDGGSCFTGETLISMADGSSRPIATLSAGDLVLGDDGRVNQIETVLMPTLGDRPIFAFNGEEFFVTASHPFQTDDGWKAIDPAETYQDHALPGVGRLRVGDRLVLLSGVLVPVGATRATAGDSLEIQTEPFAIATIVPHSADPATQLYHLRLDGNHTYFANGLLVHNK